MGNPLSSEVNMNKILFILSFLLIFTSVYAAGEVFGDTDLSTRGYISTTDSAYLFKAVIPTLIVGSVTADTVDVTWLITDSILTYYGIWTDTGADSVTIGHDGTDFVITGDGGTTMFELEGLDIELQNAATIIGTSVGHTDITDTLGVPYIEATKFLGTIKPATGSSTISGVWIGTGMWAAATDSTKFYLQGMTSVCIPIFQFLSEMSLDIADTSGFYYDLTTPDTLKVFVNDANNYDSLFFYYHVFE